MGHHPVRLGQSWWLGDTAGTNDREAVTAIAALLTVTAATEAAASGQA